MQLQCSVRCGDLKVFVGEPMPFANGNALPVHAIGLDTERHGNGMFHMAG